MLPKLTPEVLEEIDGILEVRFASSTQSITVTAGRSDIEKQFCTVVMSRCAESIVQQREKSLHLSERTGLTRMRPTQTAYSGAVAANLRTSPPVARTSPTAPLRRSCRSKVSIVAVR